MNSTIFVTLVVVSCVFLYALIAIYDIVTKGGVIRAITSIRLPFHRRITYRPIHFPSQKTEIGNELDCMYDIDARSLYEYLHSLDRLGKIDPVIHLDSSKKRCRLRIQYNSQVTKHTGESLISIIRVTEDIDTSIRRRRR